MADNVENQNIPTDDFECWREAVRYVSNLGAISHAVAGTARAMLTDQAASDNSDNKDTVVLTTSAFAIERLLHSPSVLSHLYYATDTYYREKLQDKGQIWPKDLVMMIGPRESAILLMIIYFYRRILTRAEDRECLALTHHLQIYLNLAHALGEIVPSIGVQTALMVAAGRYLGWGAFLSRNLKIYKKYKVAIKLKRVPFDVQQEKELWGTTHAHIACSMFQSFGFGVGLVDAYIIGVLAPDFTNLTPEQRAFAAAQQWMDALLRTGKAPTGNVPPQFSPDVAGLAELQAMAKQSHQIQTPDGWLFRRRTDLNPESTPHLQFDFSKIKPSKRAIAKEPGPAE